MTTIITIISQMSVHHSSGTQDYISYVHYRPVTQHTALFCKVRPKITLFVCKGVFTWVLQVDQRG